MTLTTYDPQRQGHSKAHFFPFFGCFAFFLAFFALWALGWAGGHPFTEIFVVSLISWPFCAISSVGIVNFCLHKFPFAASAENLPSGSVTSAELKGVSGSALNVDEVTPDLLMKVSPTRITFTPLPWSTIYRLGKASPPLLTKYIGPSIGTPRIGVWTFM
jgi:hypothetical protein